MYFFIKEFNMKNKTIFQVKKRNFEAANVIKWRRSRANPRKR